jgi:hypothetical protein
MKLYNKHRYLNYFIAAVWFTSGFFCKVLNLVPRHQQIVERIMGPENGSFYTKSIGVLEVGMAIWILTGFMSRFNTIAQIAIIAVMNILEFALAPDLLLWGRANAFFALLFIILIYYNEYSLNRNLLG